MATLSNKKAYNKTKKVKFPEFILHRSVMVEKSCPELNILEEQLSGMTHMKSEFYVKGNLIIVLVQSPWAGKKMFGNKSGVTYVMGIVISKTLLNGLVRNIIIANKNKGAALLDEETDITLRSLLMLNFRESISILSEIGYTGMYAIPTKGKTIFLNTLMELFKKYRKLNMYLSDEEKFKCHESFHESLPMLKLNSKEAYITNTDVQNGILAKRLPFPERRYINKFLEQVSLWEKGLGFNVKLIEAINDYTPDLRYEKRSLN